MRVRINRTKIVKKECNRVKSHLTMEPHKRQRRGFIFTHDEGIFSNKIFGNLYKCECGEVKGEGYCEKCGYRVVDPANMPDFWIDLTTFVPVFLADYDFITKITKQPVEVLQGIMQYEKFMHLTDDENSFEIMDFSPDMKADFESNKILIGVDALKRMGVPDEWLEDNVVDYLSIPHTTYRPLVINNNTPFVTPINELYSSIIRRVNNAIDMHEFAQGNPLYLMAEYKTIVRLYQEICEKLFDELQNVKYSLLKSEVISHPISGAIRAVLINRHDIHEDVLLIGDTLIETLFPYYFRKFHGDMARINEELINKEVRILINRPPTICHMSIIGLKPRVASLYPFGRTDGTDHCLKQNWKLIEERKKEVGEGKRAFGCFEDRDGDFEKYSIVDCSDGVDTMGLRTIAMNPLPFDGLAADTDGDVLLSIAIYSDDAKAQADGILPSKTYINYANMTIRNHIIEDFVFITGKTLDEGLDEWKHLPRDEYFQKNQEMAEELWNKENLPTVADIADFINGQKNEPLERIFHFFDNEESFKDLAFRKGASYNQDESEAFIRKVMSANNDDISKAGYFYKLLMASADDFLITGDDCGGDGVEWHVDENMQESDYAYRIKGMWINEWNDFYVEDFNQFMKDFKGKTIHVRTPLTCNHKKQRGVCKKCAGILPNEGHGIKNIGTFTTLMVTEHATQSALSSMNKGRKDNINDALQEGCSEITWEGIDQWIYDLCERLKNNKVAARFYEIALLSRVRKEDDGTPFVISLKTSINYSGNLFGSYIFTANDKKFKAMIDAKEFDDSSLKLQIAMNDFSEGD